MSLLINGHIKNKEEKKKETFLVQNRINNKTLKKKNKALSANEFISIKMKKCLKNFVNQIQSLRIRHQST